MKKIPRAFSLLFFLASGLLQADPIPDDSRVLFLGSAASTHGAALQSLIDGDSMVSDRGITVDSFETTDLRNAYYTAANGSLSHPSNINPLQQKLDEGWDVILINLSDLNIRVSPEMGMEGIRLVEQYVRGTGAELFILVPSFDPTFNGDAGYKTTATDVKERAYRIADALEIGAIPVGICWQTVLADGSISATDTSLAAPTAYAVNTYITTIFSELFEASAATSTYRHGGINGTEFALIAGHAQQTWQDALNATHYTGDYVGIFSPMPDGHDAANKHTGWGGASTEGMTRTEWQKIYQRQSVPALSGDHKGVDFSQDYDFYVHRGWLYDSSINYYRSLDPGNDLRTFALIYKSNSLTQMVGWGLSRSGDYQDWFYATRASSTLNFGPQPYKRFVPNMPGFVRYWADYPDARAQRYGDSHLNENLIMMQGSMIYTMSSAGANPLENITDLEAWTGPQRYAAGLGYAMIMGIGRLEKLEMAPVATAFPRFEMTANTANDLTLPGHDFNGLPVTASIVTPPAHGSLVPNGSDFTYTPDPNFSGVDTVTYRVNNGIEDSLPLTVALVVGPYIPPSVTGTVFFEENFDDENIDDWNLSGTAIFVNESSTSRTWRDGFSQPYDGTAGIWLTGAGGEISKVVDTTGFENIHLSIRVGSGNSRDEDDYPDEALVEWFDGTTWHTAVSHGHTYFTNRLLYGYEVALPAAAAENPEFQLRLYGKGVANNKNWKGAYFDSIRLSGDVIPIAPVASDLSLQVAEGVPIDFTVEVSDSNIFDTLTYSYSQPAHGTVTGDGPSLTYTPDPGYIGLDSFTFEANDGSLDSNLATVTLNVRNNSAPEVDAGSDLTAVLTDYIPLPTTGEDILLDADLDDGVDTLWEDSAAIWDLTLDAGVSLVSTDVSSLPGIMKAYDFPGGVSGAGGATGSSLENLGWNDEAVTIEIWFKPDSTADDGQANGQILFETGGGTGLGIFYNDGTVEIGHDATEVISAVDVTPFSDEFIQVALSYDVTGTDDFILYINGAQMATGNRNDSDWSGSDGAGLGTRGGSNAGGRGSGDADTESFEGRIALFRAYRGILLSPDQVRLNYESIAGGLRASVELSPAVFDAEGDVMEYTWTQVSGPGAAAFVDETAKDTTVTFLEPGTYVLRLTSDDGLEQTYDEITVTVPQPIVDDDNDGLDDAWETLHFPGQEAVIDGTADSDLDGVLDFFEYLSDTDPNVGDGPRLALQAGRSDYGPSSVFKWTVKDGFSPGVHYQVLYSTDLSQGSWNPLPEEHRTLRPNLHDGMNTVEMEVTHDYGENLFIRLSQP